MQTEEMQTEAQQLLLAYYNAPTIDLRNDLVMLYSYIPKAVAAQMRGVTSSYAQLEDIVNQGVITLIDCIEKFDPTKGVKFESYAFMRVKCANIDFVRKQDWLPRRVRKTAKDVATAHDELSNQLMREPTTKELAQHMGVDEATVTKHYREISNSVMVSFENLLQNAAENDAYREEVAQEDTMPEANLARQELRVQLAMAIDCLTEKERLVVSLYYYEHLKLCEIAQVMKVSEARVCQTRAKAIGKLRDKLQLYLEG